MTLALTAELVNLNKLESRARRESYWVCLEQVRAARIYAELLEPSQGESLRRIERWLDLESYLFVDDRWWPTAVPGLLYQQLFNRSVEEGDLLTAEGSPVQWVRQENQTGAEDGSLLRVFAGHEDKVTSAVFSPNGTMLLWSVE